MVGRWLGLRTDSPPYTPRTGEQHPQAERTRCGAARSPRRSQAAAQQGPGVRYRQVKGNSFAIVLTFLHVAPLTAIPIPVADIEQRSSPGRIYYLVLAKS